MRIKSAADLEGMKRIGKIVRLALNQMAAAANPGITTAELSEIGERVLKEHGAESTPPKVYDFPGAVCISVNDEAIHGIPKNRVLNSGDLLKLDLTADKDGYVADAAITVPVGEVSSTATELMRCAERAFHAGIAAARHGTRVNEIGRLVERETRRSGFNVIKSLCGHGVGRKIHEEPQVPNYFARSVTTRLVDGMVITVEPIIAAGSGADRKAPDGWTIRTADGTLAAHFEHTILITKDKPILLTVAS
jgi:methionyl aminopeptidase